MKLGLYDKISGNLIDTIPDGEVSGYMLDQYFILRGETFGDKVLIDKKAKKVTQKDIDGNDIAVDVDCDIVDGVEYTPMMNAVGVANG